MAVIIPNLVRDLGGTEKIPWMALAFSLAGTSLILIQAKAMGIFNVKYLFLFNFFLFLVGSALCGAANNMDSELAGRVIAGVGAFATYLGCLTFISVLTVPRERPAYLGLTGLVWGGGVVLGPIVGGGFHDSPAGWRWAFYINLLIGAVCVPVYLFLLPPVDPQPNKTLKEKISSVDWFGVFLSAGFLILLIGALTMGGVLWAWDSAGSISFFVVGFVLLVGFVLVEQYEFKTTFEDRLFPMHFLKNPTMLILFASTAASAAATLAPINYIPLLFQFTRGDKAIVAAVRLLPLICTLIFFAVTSGWLIGRIGLYKPFYVVGSALLTTGAALMYTIDDETSNAAIYGYMILIGTGAGLFFQNSFAIAQGSIEPHEIPFAVGFILLAQSAGGALGFAVSGAIFVNKSIEGLSALLPGVDHRTLEHALSGVGSELIANLEPELRKQALKAIVDGLRQTFAGAIAGGAVVFVASLFMKWERLKVTGAAPL